MKTDIGHFDASQNFEEMGTEFTLSLRFYENIDILPAAIPSKVNKIQMKIDIC
jgi:hypothetical protein